MRRLLDIDPGGRPSASEVRVQRWHCTGCAAYFTELPPEARPRSLATIAARDAVAEACFQAGYAPAAARFGIDEKTARSLWDDWAAPRERDLPQRPPEFMGLHVAVVAGAERTVVTDVEAMAVVDVLRGAGTVDVVTWLDGMEDAGRVENVAIAMHQPFRDAATTALPGVRMLVCPAHAAMQGTRAFLSAFRTVVRRCGPIRGSNVLGIRSFAKSMPEMTPGEREDMAAWDDAILGLHDAKERFLAALSTTRRRDALSLLQEARERCLTIPGGSIPASLMASWREEMATGAETRGLDSFTGTLGDMTRLWAGRKPSLPFDVARGLAVLRDGPRAMSTPGEQGETETLGVYMTDVLEALAA